jgi:hypothetical protein
MDMNLMPRSRVSAYLESLGLDVLDAVPTSIAGINWPGFRYYSRKPPVAQKLTL